MFKGQMSLIQMVFHKEGRGGIGGAERIGGLLGLRVEGGAWLRAHILEGENRGVLVPSLIVGKGMTESIRVSMGDGGTTKICLWETGMGRCWR